jgi:hypothetical protein
MYNLLPSCASCNLNKGDKDFWINDYCHPYLESCGDLFRFTLGRESDKTPYAKSTEIEIDDLDMFLTYQGLDKPSTISKIMSCFPLGKDSNFIFTHYNSYRTKKIPQFQQVTILHPLPTRNTSP